MAEQQRGTVVCRDVAEVAAHIDQWRRTRGKLGPMPEELWARAVHLARKHGVGATARALGLDGGKLSRLMRAEAEPSAAPSFVEVSWAPSVGWGCVVEMARRDGAKMTVRLATVGAELGALTELFWGAGR